MALDAKSRWNKISMTKIANEWNFQKFLHSWEDVTSVSLWPLEYLPLLKPPRRVLCHLRAGWKQ